MFRNLENGAWRALRINGDGVLQPPAEGWDRYKYVVVAGNKPQRVSESVEKERKEGYREREPIEFGEIY